MPIDVHVAPIYAVSEATITDFMDELLQRLGVDPDSVEPSDRDDIECFIAQWAQSYWTADTPFETEI